ncbi:MAG: glycine--tRNA ligase subunit beta, partial [Thermoanaerobaculia bacterium]|nr:glycine--tRNA ligase subunit beta [Thermoanaerobaculia bacterium]
SIWMQWSYLTEYPGVVRSEFDESFLKLPEEVLVTVMRVHQKQLPIEEDGKLGRHFLSIVDADSDPKGFASSGNAFVTNARFADALFFLEVDLKRDLGERIDDLSHLQFQEQLGDYARKTDRICSIASAILEEIDASVSAESLEEACRLSKVDLLTEMVKEFTDLQGRIGGIYAARQGREEEVWKAIYDQYLPQSLEDDLPETEGGAILSLADRADNLAGFFLLGLEPTGSRDPFALRRAAQGIVRILFNEDRWTIPLDVERLVRIALDAYPDEIGGDREETAAKLLDFISERVRNVLETSWSFAYDEVAAAMSSGWSESLPDLRMRTAALHDARRSREFLSILDSARRISNITPEGFEGRVREDLLEEEQEKRLYELGRTVRSQIAELIGEGSYERALQSFAGMAGELEKFFDEVLVNVENQEIRENRLSVLRIVGDAVAGIGDVTKIVVDRKALDSSGR